MRDRFSHKLFALRIHSEAQPRNIIGHCRVREHIMRSPLEGDKTNEGIFMAVIIYQIPAIIKLSPMWLFLFISFCMSLPASAQTSQFRSHLANALSLYEQNRDVEAENEINRAIAADKSSAEAYRLLAKIRLRKGTIQGRDEAEEAVRKAIRYDPANLDHRFALIEVYHAQGFPEKAQNYLEGLRREFPDNPKVLYELGKLYQKRAAQLQGMVSLEGEAILDYGKFYGEKLSAVKKIYGQLSKIAPHYQDLDRELTLLAYMEKDWDKMIEYASGYAGMNGENKHAHLILGLAFLRKGQYDKSKDEFDVYDASLTEYEKIFFTTFDSFLSGEQQVEIEKMSYPEKNDFHRDFWFSRDPLFITDYNERFLEHYARIAEAYLLFSSPEYNVIGYESPPGVIWIRYGPPLQRRKAMHIEFFNPDFDYRVDPLNEYWYYKDFMLRFYEFPLWSKKMDFYAKDGVNYAALAHEIQKQIPETFEFNIPGKKIDFPRIAADFRGKEGISRVELFYAIPVKDLRHTEREAGYVADIDNGVFVFDSDWNNISRETWRQEHVSPLPIDSANHTMLTFQRRMDLPPGTYTLAVEFRDDSSGNIGAIRDPLDVESYGYDALQISDILLADDIKAKAALEAVTLDNVEFTPNISRRFRQAQPVFLYFEVYNLRLTGVPGNSRFRVEYSMQYKRVPEDAEWSIGDVLGRLFSFSRNQFELATTAEYDGVSPVENMFIQIDPSSLEPGLYLLVLRVSDLIGGNLVEKNVGFYILQ